MPGVAQTRFELRVEGVWIGTILHEAYGSTERA